MRAVHAPKNDGVLVIEELPEPICGDEDVLVAVHAAGVNRLDILQKFGKYPVPPGVCLHIPQHYYICNIFICVKYCKTIQYNRLITDSSPFSIVNNP